MTPDTKREPTDSEVAILQSTTAFTLYGLLDGFPGDAVVGFKRGLELGVTPQAKHSLDLCFIRAPLVLSSLIQKTNNAFIILTLRFNKIHTKII